MVYQNPPQMTTNLAPDNDQEVNTHFSEQRVVESQQAYPSSSIQLPPAVEQEMADDTWYAKQQLMKPVQLAQVAWSTSIARDTDIYSVNFPQVLESVDSIVLRTLRMYAFYKLTPCFRVQLNATQFHQGQLICSFDPFSISSRLTTPTTLEPLFDLFYATGLPNVKIMASESDAVELCVPFIHPRSFLTTNSTSTFNNLGAFRITVLNPLIVADGTSPSISVTIWVYAKDAQVHVPIYDHTPILDDSTLPPNETNQRVVVATSKIFDSISSPFSSLTSQLSNLVSPIISSVNKGAKQAHTMYGNIISGNVGQALRTGQGLIDTLGDLFGFDYPARTIQPPKTISAVENLAVSIGQSQSQRMALDPFSLHHLPDEIAGESIDSMNLMRIAKMPMLLSQFVFSGSSPIDSLLFSTPVTPTVSAIKNGFFRRTYLSAVANAFTYWSGGINFDIEVIATKFHSGKLLFAFVPNDVAIPTYTQAATSLPNIIVDIQQTSSTRFKIPYVSSTSLKNCQRQLSFSTTAVTDLAYEDSCIGTLVCYVQNTLAYASNVSSQVEINMYIAAGDDFSLYVPCKPLLDKTFTPGERTVVATSNQIGIDTNKNNDVQTNSVLAKGSGQSIPRSHFGENYSLIDIIRRFNFYNSYALSLAQPDSIPVTPDYLTLSANTTIVDNYPMISYFSSLYSCFSGTLRYKIIPSSNRVDRLSLLVSHIPSLSLINNFFEPEAALPSPFQGIATLLTQTQQDAAIEFEVPYYSKFNMLVMQQPDADYALNGLVAISTKGTLSESLTTLPLDIYIAAGEDFRFIYLRPLGADTTNISYSVTTL
ncbi:hypothetical protein 1 [Hubei picorna-like virus 51]|uniref:hypothetical protein 1 n=1 Tax=Hubei picorna-like virus 51 TaxID=1923133 RepID=UPI00090B1E7E|nr:hypothetical protein 1 [Hubei picorna-like virus 51]APG78002.1 hypothetical protein 1 [Hubei picorna-like virus 51]